MNALVAELIAGFCGLCQLAGIMAIETHDHEEQSGLLSSDKVFPLFVLLVMTEILCVMALSIYRIAPWLLRITGEKWEADRGLSAKKRYGAILQRTTVAATITRRIVVMIDANAFSLNLTLSLCIALITFLVPRPKA